MRQRCANAAIGIASKAARASSGAPGPGTAMVAAAIASSMKLTLGPRTLESRLDQAGLIRSALHWSGPGGGWFKRAQVTEPEYGAEHANRGGNPGGWTFVCP